MKTLIRAAGFVYGFIQAASEHNAQRRALAAVLALAERLPISVDEADEERQKLARHFHGGGVA